jgi:16S rRNA (cytidine1402-2'-O)-methyltransferase
MNPQNYGILYVVATPIGNLSDITLRALEILKQVDCIAAEDTRHSKKLLEHFDIKKPMISLHNYNEGERSKVLLKRLQKGENLALISDAGTPLISDPGYQLIKFVREAKINVVPVPGPCAAITALCVSGLPTDKFIFEGFLPAKAAARRKRLEELITEPRTIIFYEAPHRIKFLINDLLNVFGKNRHAVLARELTKKFETIYGANLSELKSWLEVNKVQQKGEFVILLHGAEPKKTTEINEETLRILKILLSELSVKQAIVLATKITGESKNKLYKVAVMHRKHYPA